MLPPRSFTTTLAPWEASISACSRPIPRPAPVTTQMRPSQIFATALSSRCPFAAPTAAHLGDRSAEGQKSVTPPADDEEVMRAGEETTMDSERRAQLAQIMEELRHDLA